MKSVKHKYYVVQFLKKPYDNVDDYVCVPGAWISSRKKSHSRVFVRYPSMIYPSMKKIVRRRRKFRKEWKFYLADVASHTDLYSEAVSVIKTMKFNYQSTLKQMLCEPQSIVPTKTDVQGVVKKAYSPDDEKEETLIITYLENENHTTIESLNIKNNLLEQELQMQNINIGKDNELNKSEKNNNGKRSMIHESNKQNTNYTKQCRQVLNNLKENKYPSHFTSAYKSHLQTRNNTLENIPNYNTLYDVGQIKNINFTSHVSEPVDYVDFQPNYDYDHYICQNLHLPKVAQKSNESNENHQRTCPERSKHCDITGHNYYTDIVNPLRQPQKSAQDSQLPFHYTHDIYLEPRDKTLPRQSHTINNISEQIELSQKNEMNMLTIQKPIYNCLADTFVERSIEANEINKIAYPETVVNDSITRYSFTNFANQPSHSSKDLYKTPCNPNILRRSHQITNTKKGKLQHNHAIITNAEELNIQYLSSRFFQPFEYFHRKQSSLPDYIQQELRRRILARRSAAVNKIYERNNTANTKRNAPPASEGTQNFTNDFYRSSECSLKLPQYVKKISSTLHYSSTDTKQYSPVSEIFLQENSQANKIYNSVSDDNSDQLVFPQRLTENYSTIAQPNPNNIKSTGSFYSHVKQFSTDVQAKLYQEMSSLETSKRSTDKLVSNPLQKYFSNDCIADKDFKLTFKQRSPSIHEDSLYGNPYVDKTNLKKCLNLDNSELSNHCKSNMQNKPVNTQNSPNVSNESLYTDASTKQTFLENILVILEKTNTIFTNTCNYMLNNEHKNQNSEGYEWIEAFDLLRLINQNNHQHNNPTSLNSEETDKKPNTDNNKELNLVISMLMMMIVKLNMLIHMMANRKLQS